jgi:hypothetical protein
MDVLEPPQESQNTEHGSRRIVRTVIGAGGLALVLAAIGQSFSTAGVTSMPLAIAWLIAAWIIGTAAIAVSEPVWGLRSRHRIGVTLGSCIALGILLIGTGYLEYYLRPMPTAANARLEFVSIRIEKIPNTTENKIYFHFINHGSLAAIGPKAVTVHVILENVVTEDQTNQQMEALLKIREARGAPLNNSFEMQPGENSFTEEPTTISDDDLQKVRDNKAYFYLFAIVMYKDKTTPNGYFITEVCRRSQGEIQLWLKCKMHERIYKYN